MSNAVGRLRELVESELKPKDALQSALRDVDLQDSMMHCQVLVAMYAGDKFVAGSKTILRSDRNLLEQQYQGTVGLVMAMGPTAFHDAPGAQFGGRKPQVGDWVYCRPSDGLQTLINSVPCRIFDDVHIKAIVTQPEMFW